MMKSLKEMDWKRITVTLLRVAIGWHLLYEGVSKLVVENWTALDFLVNTTGFFSGFYHWLASSESLMAVIDPLNMYGLILIGMGLFVPPNTSAIMGSVPKERLGTASAMVATLRHIGMSVGLAISGSVFTASRFSHATQLTSQELPQDVVGKLSTRKMLFS